MFKGYISNTIGHVRWIIHSQKSFLLPYLEQITERLRERDKRPNNTLLTVIRKDRYKTIGEFEVTQAGKAEAYLVKIYKYPDASQRIKHLFKHTKAFHEFNTTYLAAIKGVPVEVPVAYGERKRLFTKESYLIIRKIIHSWTLREYFQRNTSLKEKKDILEKFGTLAKNIHDAGVRQDDFSLDNFLAYNNEILGKKVILIDFERVSIQANPLSDKQRVWYLAKLNRAKRCFTNTDRLRFLSSYTNGDPNYCKKLARQIETTTIHIQKKDARKFYKQCIQENRKFGIVKNIGFYGYYRKNYSPGTLLPLLDAIGETAQEVCYIKNFRVVRFMENARTGQDYRNITQAWMHANALFALRIDVLVPVGMFKRSAGKLPKGGFLISEMPENCIPLEQYDKLHPDKTSMQFALLRLAEQVSPFGVFRVDLSTQDILVQANTNQQAKCYLANYASFHRNQNSLLRNKSINTSIVKQRIPVVAREKELNH